MESAKNRKKIQEFNFRYGVTLQLVMEQKSEKNWKWKINETTKVNPEGIKDRIYDYKI